MTGMPGAVKLNSRLAGCPVVVAITVTLIALLLNGGCSRRNFDDFETPRVLRVALIPDRPPADLEWDFQPLLDYVSSQTGFAIELLRPHSYEETLALFASGQLDMVRFGGYSFVLAHQRYGAQAMVTRDVDLRFRSLIVTRADTAGKGLESLRGQSLGFGPRYSTSGHVMARAFLQRQGIVPEEFFGDVRYAKNHVDNIRALMDGEIDAAVVNKVIFEQKSEQREDTMRTLQVVWTSPSYANYVWAVRDDLEIEARHAIREAFLALTMMEKDHVEILGRVGAAGFLPAQQKNYDLLMSYVRNEELSLP